MFKPGTITKVSVTNFVTYTSTDFFPGPNMNLLIGPNGSGKSTMVAAIILGLGGNAKIVGRGHNITDYIKHNCEKAKITIYIRGESANIIHTITREFDKRNTNLWTFDGAKKTAKEILAFVKKFHIQVDNLCQFLPQEKVQDFAKLNKIDLLKQTQLALCRQDLLDKQDVLINKRDRQKHLADNLERLKKNEKQLKDTNLRLEGRVKNFENKRKYMEKIDDIKRKKKWVKYLELGKTREGIKKLSQQSMGKLQKLQGMAKPIENSIAQAKIESRELENETRVTVNALSSLDNGVNRKLEGVEQSKESIAQVRSDKQYRLKQIDEREKEVKSCQMRLDQLNRDKSEIADKFQGESGMVQKLRSCNAELQVSAKNKMTLEDKRQELLQSKREKSYEIRNIENELERLQNVQQQRLEYLRRIDQDAYTGTMWLRQNKHLFRGTVYEPIMLEVNVIKPEYAMYVENSISFRDKVAFACTNADDMNLLMSHFKTQQNLSVNCIEVQENRNPLQPNHPIERLSKFGFQSYVFSLFTAPPPIMHYLCKTFNMHNIPVAFQNTDFNCDHMPKNIGRFYRGKLSYAISQSRYTGVRSKRQNEIKSDNSLSLTIDQVRIETLSGRQQELKNECDSFDIKIRDVDEKVTQVNQRYTKIRDAMQNIKNARQQVETIDSRINIMTTKLAQVEAINETKEIIEAECEKKLNEIIKKITASVEEIKNAYRTYSEKLITHNVSLMKVDVARNKITVLENEAYDVRRQVTECETEVNRLKDDVARSIREVKLALQDAKNASGGFSPDDQGFEEFRVSYETLPADMKELDEEENILTSKVDCLMNSASSDEIREYEERIKSIQDIESNIERENFELNEINDNIEVMFTEWMEPLEGIVNEINARFSQYFEKMGYAGEISVSKGENPKDFEKYGMNIKVTYRDSHPLQELNTTVQSGGERAVATAAYMLSLQDLTPVPFRCVDEINQGMDAHNERLMFDLMVYVTNQPDTPQYFLVTPKLIPKLAFSETMKIHIVHNGPYMMSQSKWNKAVGNQFNQNEDEDE